jgi:hypothetical protein
MSLDTPRPLIVIQPSHCRRETSATGRESTDPHRHSNRIRNKTVAPGRDRQGKVTAFATVVGAEGCGVLGIDLMYTAQGRSEQAFATLARQLEGFDACRGLHALQGQGREPLAASLLGHYVISISTTRPSRL